MAQSRMTTEAKTPIQSRERDRVEEAKAARFGNEGKADGRGGKHNSDQ